MWISRKTGDKRMSGFGNPEGHANIERGGIKRVESLLAPGRWRRLVIKVGVTVGESVGKPEDL